MRLGARRSEVAQVDRCRAEPELTPGEPVEPEVHPLDERILRGDKAVDDGRVVLQLLREPALFELGEQAELADVTQSHGESPRHPGPRG